MSLELALTPPDFESRAISPVWELGAYEAVWDAAARWEAFRATPDAPARELPLTERVLKT